MRILCIPHVAFEKPAAIAKWATLQEHVMTYVHLYASDPFPQLSECEAVIVCGGPMSVHDEARYAWLRPEKEFLARVVA